jgi:hypothetical protein
MGQCGRAGVCPVCAATECAAACAVNPARGRSSHQLCVAGCGFTSGRHPPTPYDAGRVDLPFGVDIDGDLPFGVDMVIVSSHLPEHSILKVTEMRGEAVQVGRVKVQRPVSVVQTIVDVIMVIGRDNPQTIARACGPCGRRVKHRMEAGGHRYGEPKPSNTDLGSCVGGTR